jgi:hypothetical protein
MSTLLGPKRTTFLSVSLSALILSSSVSAMIALLILPQLANSTASATFPGDNGLILFVKPTDGLFTMNPDGTGVTEIPTGGVQDPTLPYWSPDGTQILFGAGHEEFYWNLMNADGSNLKTRLASEDIPKWSSGWSPDSTKFAFSVQSGTDLTSGIQVMNADGSNQIHLTTSNDRNPSWSPDGNKILFSRDWTDIYVMDADGTNVEQLTNGSDNWPTWSPDGTKIAFVRAGGQANSDIYVMDADGTNLVQLTHSTTLQEFTNPSWQPIVKTGTIADATNQATGQSVYQGARTFYGEKFGAGAEVISSVVDCATVELRKHGSPSGVAEIGFYDPEMNLIRQFGTKDVSTLTTGYKQYEFCLPTTSAGHLIVENQILAVAYDSGDALNRIDVRRSNTGAGPDYDGLASYHVNFDTSWHVYNAEGNSRDLLFKLTNS